MFRFLATVTVPLATVVQIYTLVLGQELTYGGRLAPSDSASVRYMLIALALSSVVAAMISRRRER